MRDESRLIVTGHIYASFNFLPLVTALKKCYPGDALLKSWKYADNDTRPFILEINTYGEYCKLETI